MATYLSTRTTPPPHIVPPSVRDEEIDLRTLMGTLADSKKLILFGTLMFLLASVLYVVLATPKYEATATVQVERRAPTFPGLSQNAAVQATSAESPAATEIQLLTSRSVLSEALDNLDLDVHVQPARFPVFGNYVARNFVPERTGDVNALIEHLNLMLFAGTMSAELKFDILDAVSGVTGSDANSHSYRARIALFINYYVRTNPLGYDQIMACVFYFGHARNKAIASARDCLDVLRAVFVILQRLSQCEDVMREISFFDNGVGPDLFHQFVFAENVATVFYQRH